VVDEAIEKMEAESQEYAESRSECPECGYVVKGEEWDGHCLDPSCPYKEEGEDAA
jgi:rubrerythrin